MHETIALVSTNIIILGFVFIFAMIWRRDRETRDRILVLEMRLKNLEDDFTDLHISLAILNARMATEGQKKGNIVIPHDPVKRKPGRPPKNPEMKKPLEQL